MKILGLMGVLLWLGMWLCPVDRMGPASSRAFPEDAETRLSVVLETPVQEAGLAINAAGAEPQAWLVWVSSQFARPGFWARAARARSASDAIVCGSPEAWRLGQGPPRLVRA